MRRIKRLSITTILVLLVSTLVFFLVRTVMPSTSPPPDVLESNVSELWHKSYDSGNWDAALDAAVDSERNIIVAGSSQKWHDYNNNGQEDQGEVNGDYYTIKYDEDGKELWSRVYEGGAWDYAYGVAVDFDRNIVVTGACEKWHDYNENKQEDPKELNYDYYTIKYNPNGKELWSKAYDSERDDDQAFAVAVDSEDNVIVTGSSSDGKTLNYCTIKYDKNGKKLWSKTYDGGDTDCANGVAVDSQDNIIVTGYSSDGKTLNYCTIKYRKDGTEVWNEPLIYDGGYDDGALEVAVDSADNMVVTGSSSDGLTSNYCTIKYDQNGSVFTGWPVTYDSGYDDTAFGLAVDFKGNLIVVTGSYSMPPPKGDFLGTWNSYTTFGYNPAGTGITNGWPAIYDGNDQECAYDVAIDSNGNVIVTGKVFDNDTWNYYTIKYRVAAVP